MNLNIKINIENKLWLKYITALTLNTIPKFTRIMPIFRYYCLNCDREEDYMLKRDEKPVCECGNHELTKIYMGQTFGFSVNGSTKNSRPITISINELPDGKYLTARVSSDSVSLGILTVFSSHSLESKIGKSNIN